MAERKVVLNTGPITEDERKILKAAERKAGTWAGVDRYARRRVAKKDTSAPLSHVNVARGLGKKVS